ncbi:hypothetical protein GE09DRAFT_465347 [Coniochaeta sp. 2T2.1]|nr:hypothetical protein GE09DRAFT_465347 [Coniochaeta sp. 2T2.1]
MFGRHPLALITEENDFLAEQDLRGVDVKCCYKSSSRWGVLSKTCTHHVKCPAWLLEMELDIRQISARLDYATMSLEFNAEDCMSQPDHGVLVTDFYRPSSDQGIPTQRTVRREWTINPSVPTPVGQATLGAISSSTDATITDRWQVSATRSTSRTEGDTLPRCITWTIKEARGAGEPNLALSWELGVVVRHDGEPFLIRPCISGRLQGLDRIWMFWPKFPIPPRRVTPPRNEPERELNRDAESLRLAAAVSPSSGNSHHQMPSSSVEIAPLEIGLNDAFERLSQSVGLTEQ